MARHRNVLFIVADQFRWDCLGAAGNGIIRTPHLDALAADGVSYRRCFVQGAPCGPSRASILTSRYVCSHRSVDNMTPLADAHETLPVHLRRHGCRPAIFGYNDYAVDPRILPADDPRCRGLSYANFMPGWAHTFYHEFDSPEYYARLRDRGYPETLLNLEAIHRPQVPPEGPGPHLPLRYPAPYRAEDSPERFLTEQALQYVGTQRGRGWFVNINYLRPHPPRVAAAPYHDRYDPRSMPLPNRSAEERACDHPYYRFMLRDAHDLDDSALREVQANYYGMISELDACIGGLFRGLESMGEWANTLVVFTSDHGEYLGDHHLMEKGHFYDSALAVPLVVRDPSPEADVTRGAVLDDLCESIDIAPTVLEYLHIPVPDRFQGVSVLGRVRGRTQEGKRAVFHEYDFRNAYAADAGVDPDRCLLWVVRDHAYKYVQFALETMPPLLFDLVADPGEQVNLAGRSEHAPTVARYCQHLLRWRMKHEDQRMEHWAAALRR